MVRVGPPYPEDFHCSGQSQTHLRPEEVASGLDKFAGRIIHKLCVGKTFQTYSTLFIREGGQGSNEACRGSLKGALSAQKALPEPET